jgi:hypothetical protein
VDGQKQVLSKDGSLVLSKLGNGVHTISVKTKHAYFDEQRVTVDLKNPNSLQSDKPEFKSLRSLGKLVATAFDVCGQVKVTAKFNNLPSAIQIRCYEQQGEQLKLASSASLQENLSYCLKLTANVNYVLKTEVTDDAVARVLKLVPLERKVTVSDAALFDVNFEQLEARLEGKINLLGVGAPSDLSLTLRSTDAKRQWHTVINAKCQEEKVVNQSSRFTCAFSATNLLFGDYSLTSNYDDLYCWSAASGSGGSVIVTVNSELQNVKIDQTGYRLNYKLSHRNAMLKLVDAAKNVILAKNIINEQDLTGQVCLPRIAEHTLQIDSCHVFTADASDNSNLVKVSAALLQKGANTLVLTAHRHLATVDVAFKFEDSNDRKSLDESELVVEVRRGETVEHEIKFKTESETSGEVIFRARTWLPTGQYTLHAKSGKVLFESNDKQLTVNDQKCEANQARFDAKLGIFIVVGVTPKDIDSVELVLRTASDNTTLLTKTLSGGSVAGDFQLGPLKAPFSQYTVELVKSGYLFAKTGSSSSKNVYRSEFSAEKLGQLKVSVVDGKAKTGLENVLLSLSSENRLFRQTVKTDASGQASFDNLKPSLYYLILMMQGMCFDLNLFSRVIRENANFFKLFFKFKQTLSLIFSFY